MRKNKTTNKGNTMKKGQEIKSMLKKINDDVENKKDYIVKCD